MLKRLEMPRVKVYLIDDDEVDVGKDERRLLPACSCAEEE